MMKRLLIIVLFIVTQQTVYAQNWAGGVDEEVLHFGFTFQLISSDYKILKKGHWNHAYDFNGSGVFADTLKGIGSTVSPGFGLGFVSDLKLGEHADLRFTPALAFTDRLLDYTYSSTASIADFLDPIDNFQQSSDGVSIQKKVQATMVDFPVGVKIKSDRIKNFRAYFIGGMKYSLDIISKKKTDDSQFTNPMEKLVKNKSGFLSYEAGIGLDLYFEYFKLSPEIKLSNSLNNILKPEDHPFSEPLDKLFLHSIQFSLYFE